MKYSRYKNFPGLACLLITLAITGCDNDNDSSDSKNGNTGTFIDSPVANIDYRTYSRTSVTNAAGEFIYIGREFIIFSIGDIDLPGVNATPIITPLDLAKTDTATDLTALNIARLLISLDVDGDPDNGIQIGDQAKSVAQGMAVDFSSDDFDSQVEALVANSGSVTTQLVTRLIAQRHLEDSLSLPASDPVAEPTPREPSPEPEDPDLDSDGDGVPDSVDAFPFDAEETKDTDSDGVGDNSDFSPFDANETNDSDGDGVGDNSDYAPDDETIQSICQTDASDELKAEANCSNSLPVAVITYDGPLTVSVNTDIVFDGSNSYDPDADVITYSWEILSAPEGSIASLRTPTEMNSELISMDLEGDYLIKLTVSDGLGDTFDTIIITADKSLPQASSMFGLGVSGLLLISVLRRQRVRKSYD